MPGRLIRYLLLAFAWGLPSQAAADRDGMTEVAVKPGETLNEAIEGAEGPVLIRLPEGVTKHAAPITREATVIIRGTGREASTLRPSADVPLIEQGDVMKPFEGDLVLEGFTYDRAHRHVGDAQPRSIIATNAGGDLIFRDFRTHRFNWDGQRSHFLSGVGDDRLHAAGADAPRHRYVGFHNFEIDYAYDGGIRNRPHGMTGSGQLRFNAQRFVFDADSVFRGHLMQHALPEHTLEDKVVQRKDRGPLPLGAFRFNVWDYGLIDGEIREVDYSVVRYGAVLSRDGVLEIRAHLPENGFADQFWPDAGLEGKNGHLIYDGVFLSAAEGNLWDDRGFKAQGDWKSITVRDCHISGYIAPIDFSSGMRGRGVTEQGRITITDTTILSKSDGVDIGGTDYALEGVKIDNLLVASHPDGAGFIRQAVNLRESEDSNAIHQISNVVADNYVSAPVNSNISPDSRLITENIVGRKGDAPVVEDAYAVASIPREPMEIDGDASDVVENFEPIATLEDFENREEFSRLDVYMSHDGPGVYLTVIVGADGLSNTREEPGNAWRGDALQFAITEGMPGEHSGYVLFDLAKHNERGLHVYRRNFWPDRELSDGLIDLDESEAEMAVVYDEAKKETVYQVLLPWEAINLPAPWYDVLSVDLVATRGETYPQIKGTAWFSPYESLREGEDKESEAARGGGIFHPPTVPTQGFKAVEAE